jgi:endonuclease I
LTRQPQFSAVLLCAAALLARCARADAFDPPVGYYSTATGGGATLKQQLHEIIDDHTSVSYDSARANLQVTDEDPNDPSRMLLVYNRASLDVSAINPDGPIPGWDLGASWQREHSWPRSRGIGESGPDDADLHHLRPIAPSVNAVRENFNYGGQYGLQLFGVVVDGGEAVWYPGDADAGMTARQQFYMAVRYDDGDASTSNLELGAGHPGFITGDEDPPPQLGDLNRLVEWHFAAPPDHFERRRNQIIYDNFQHNRNPFIDRPEFLWSVFVDEANDSQITIDGATPTVDGGSLRHVDLGRVYVGGALPAPEVYSLDKTGMDGTYFEVTTAGAATSSIGGRFNAFRMGGPFNQNIAVGLNTSTATSGLKTGTVTVDNLDITTAGGLGHGANDANDVFDVSLAVLDHPVASYSLNVERREEIIDFGIVPLGSGTKNERRRVTNLAAASAPDFAANLDLDSIVGVGDTEVFDVDLDSFTGLEQGDDIGFDSLFFPNAAGQFAATYTLMLSDEDLPGGEQTQTLTLSLLAEAILSGDYNRNGAVDAADYVVWRHALGQDVTEYGGADGDGDGTIDDGDYDVWRMNFGTTAAAVSSFLASTVPEPSSASLVAGAFVVLCHFGTVRSRQRAASRGGFKNQIAGWSRQASCRTQRIIRIHG